MNYFNNNFIRCFIRDLFSIFRDFLQLPKQYYFEKYTPRRPKSQFSETKYYNKSKKRNKLILKYYIMKQIFHIFSPKYVYSQKCLSFVKYLQRIYMNYLLFNKFSFNDSSNLVFSLIFVY